MNHIGTHDTERALTMLGGEQAATAGMAEQSCPFPGTAGKGQTETEAGFPAAITLPGIPCIYYGDEAGLRV